MPSRFPWLPVALGGGAALLLTGALVLVLLPKPAATPDGSTAAHPEQKPADAAAPAATPGQAATTLSTGASEHVSSSTPENPTTDAADSEPVVAEPTPASPLDLEVARLRSSSARERARAASHLGEMGRKARRAVGPLVAALEDPDAVVQEQAALALGSIGDRSAVPALVASLERHRESEALLRGVAAAFESLRDPRAAASVPRLLAALAASDASTRLAASRALGVIADRRAVEPLLQVALHDPDSGVRSAAAGSAAALDPGARTRLQLMAWLPKIESALKQGRLVTPESESAVLLTVEAVGAAGPGAESDALMRSVSQALETEERRLVQGGAQEDALVLATRAVSLVPERHVFTAWRASLERARLSMRETARFVQVRHVHGLSIGLDDAKLTRSGCLGALELTDDGFRFETRETLDGRRDSVAVNRDQIKKLEVKKEGRQLRVSSSKGNWDFVTEPSEVRRIHAFLAGPTGAR